MFLGILDQLQFRINSLWPRKQNLRPAEVCVGQRLCCLLASKISLLAGKHQSYLFFTESSVFPGQQGFPCGWKTQMSLPLQKLKPLSAGQ